MRVYLKYINPIVAVAVLALCLLAAAFEDGRYKPDQLFEGGLSTYFIAKGLFCGSVLFIMGRILLAMVFRPRTGD